MRFFFNIRDGETLIPDDEGVILPDIESARDEARISAKELAAEEFKATRHVDGRVIEITDPLGRVIERLPLKGVLH
jgi:hypothetical protein